MVNRMYQSLIHQMYGVIGRTCGVVDGTGRVIACSELSMIDQELRLNNISLQDGPFICGEYTFSYFPTLSTDDFYSFVEGTDDKAATSAGILAVALDEIKHYCDEKFDVASFIKNLLLENVLPGELYAKCRDMSIDIETDRALFLVRTSADSDISAGEVLATFFPDRSKNFIVSFNDTDTVVVFESTLSMAELEKLANSIRDTFSSEYFSRCYIGIGTISKNIKDIARSYKEAQLALEVGKVFDSKKHIISYENLGIGRLIFQLPRTLCDMFIKEVFKDGSIHMLDSETLVTIQKFFENNLNVSETSRKLFIHRNTLVYRLDKIKKLTGLDIREFDNAITFKVAIMVHQYLSSSDDRI